MYIPGFDISNLSDDELLNKQQDIPRKISYLSSFGGSPEAVVQLRNMSTAIDAERLERIYKDNWEARQKMFPQVIESDPSMINENKTEPEKNNSSSTQKKPQQQSVSIMRRTSTPVVEDK